MHISDIILPPGSVRHFQDFIFCQEANGSQVYTLKLHMSHIFLQHQTAVCSFLLDISNLIIYNILHSVHGRQSQSFCLPPPVCSPSCLQTWYNDANTHSDEAESWIPSLVSLPINPHQFQSINVFEICLHFLVRCSSVAQVQDTQPSFSWVIEHILYPECPFQFTLHREAVSQV